ncbi:MAG: hypothetical protein Q7S79_02695 [bacterium]|nr:hypothetical protein [bacterium]
METWQYKFVMGLLVYSLLCFFKGFVECRKKNYYGQSWIFLFFPLGAYVWADAVVLGLFWVFSTAVLLYLNNWWLFLTYYFVFLSIRHIGETIYWFNQQFSTIERNPGKERPLWRFFKDEHTVHFVYQVMWQCASVAPIVLAIYSAHRWIIEG